MGRSPSVLPLSSLRWFVRGERGGQAVTNAWLKLFELFGRYGFGERLLPEGGGGGGTLRAFCNAELPGAFVAAISHFMATAHPGAALDWVASSLFPAPGSGALADDYGLLAGNPERWLMSAEMRGDVGDVSDIRALAAAARARLGGGCDLYSSDVGIGLQGASEYADSEELTARLHLGQVLVGLLSLRPGGCLVAKTYTFLRPYGVSVLAVLAALFDETYIDKPCASRGRNSETYLVGIGYRGAPAAVLESLERAVRDFDFARPLVDLADPAFAGVGASALAASRALAQRQIRRLDGAMAAFFAHRRDPGALARAPWLRRANAEACAAWLRRHPVRALPPGRRLPTRRAGA